MKKTTALISTLMFGSLLAAYALPAAAADITNATKDTIGIIEFEKTEDDKEVEKPGKKPGDKPGPKDPEGGETGNEGPLRIVFASNFDFRTQKISPNAQTIYSSLTPWSDSKDPTEENIKDFVPTANFVQVNDMRPGKNNNGWKLSVKQTKEFTTYTSTDGKENFYPTVEDPGVEKDTLQGLKISLLGTEVHGNQAPDKKATIVSGSEVAITNEATPIMEAEAGKGIGRSSAMFNAARTEEQEGDFQDLTGVHADWDKKGDAGVRLDIPQGTNPYEAKYFATIEWALTDAP